LLDSKKHLPQQRARVRDDVVVVLVMTRAGVDTENGCAEVIAGQRIVETSGGRVVGSGQASR
jgi:hypothetical protein